MPGPGYIRGACWAAQGGTLHLAARSARGDRGLSQGARRAPRRSLRRARRIRWPRRAPITSSRDQSHRIWHLPAPRGLAGRSLQPLLARWLTTIERITAAGGGCRSRGLRRDHRGRTARSPHHARARAVRLRAHVRRVAHGVRTRDLSWPLLRRHIRPGLSRSSPTCSSNGRSPPHMEATKPALPHAPQRTQSVRKRLLVSRRPPGHGPGGRRRQETRASGDRLLATLGVGRTRTAADARYGRKHRHCL